MILQADIGAQLQRFRLQAGKKQADLAAVIKGDASKISRIESGDIVPSLHQTCALLDAIGSPEAMEFGDYLQMQWDHVPQPPFEHPDLGALIRAERCLQKLAAFEAANPTPAVLAQAQLYRAGLIAIVEHLSDINYRIAFIGALAVGKTTVLCSLFDLLVPGKDHKGLRDRSLLETGGGGTTICEVVIEPADTYELVIEPLSDDDVLALVADFCAGVLAPVGADQTAQPEKGVPKEVERALRNMAGLPKRTENLPDGTRGVLDPIVELLAKYPTQDSLASEIFARLNLWQRTKTRLVCTKGDPAVWLKSAFAAINTGRMSDVGFPKRIIVQAPVHVATGFPYRLTIVDTRGIDGSAIRPDLKACLDDVRTVSVLCSSFLSAPDLVVQRLLEHALETGSVEALGRAVMIGLARHDEALQVKDDSSGEPVAIAEDGYALKSDQVRAVLQRIGCQRIPVRMYNAGADDDPSPIREFIESVVRQLRAQRIGHIERLEGAVAALLADHQQVLLRRAQQEVHRRFSVVLREHDVLPASVLRPQQRLLDAIKGGHQRSVWAATRRAGSWWNFDMYYFVGAGVAMDVQRRTAQAFGALDAQVENMLADPTLAGLHPFLTELQQQTGTWKEELLKTATRVGDATFRPALREAVALWTECANLYGTGFPYRYGVADRLGVWFGQEEQRHLFQSLEERLQEAWNVSWMQKLNPIVMALADGAQNERTGTEG